MGALDFLNKVPIVGTIKKGVEHILDPGADANKYAGQATDTWKGVNTPDTANLTYGQQPGSAGTSMYMDYSHGFPMPIVVPADQAPPPGATPIAGAQGYGAHGPEQGDISPYDKGPELGTAKMTYVDPRSAAKYGLQGNTSWAGKHSAYDTLGPSAFQDASSAFATMGPSAAKDLKFDPEAMGRERAGSDYFQKLSATGSDPIAEADYQKRAAQAEQSRRANTLATLQSLEAKGMGNAGGQLTAGLTGAQAAASDRYQAGLDAAAEAATRRDFAAKSGAEIGHTMGADVLAADVNRDTLLDAAAKNKATGLDTFANNRLSGLDTYNTNVAGGKDAFGTNQNNATDAWGNNRYNDFYNVNRVNTGAQQASNIANWNRGNQTSDANTELRNQTNTFNKVTAPQQRFSNEVTKAGGVAGALGEQAGTSLKGNAQQFGNWQQLAEMGMGGAQAAASPSAAAAPAASPYANWSPYAQGATPPVVADPYAIGAKARGGGTTATA